MNRSLIASVGGVALALGALACDNSQLPTLNINPNSPTTAPAAPLFVDAARVTVARWLGSGVADLRGAEWVTQHLAEVQYPNEDQYNRLQSGDTQGTFNAPYSSELMDMKKVIAAGEAANDPTIWGPATVMQVYGFENLTDLWGDVPYTQALAADSDGGSLAPAYDRQQDIYASLLQRLTDAAAAMEAGSQSSTLGSSDIVYHGDMGGWIKLANSLRLRLALRMSNVDPTTANAQLTAAINDPGGLILTDDDNATVRWPGDGTYDNPWGDNFLTRDDHRMSQTLMNILLAKHDPRISIYAQPALSDSVYPGGYGGMPNGLTQDSAGKWFAYASRPGLIFYPGATSYGTFGTSAGLATPSVFFSAAETNFILAEAAERGWGGLSPSAAEGYYQAGIAASMAQWGVSSSAATAYISSVPYAGGTAGLKQIATEKWVALYGDGAQAWAEWRRTCIPVTVHAGPAAFVPYVPRRYEYSQLEYQVNASSIAAALTDMGGPDTFATRMWWDQNPSGTPTYDAANCNTPGD